jgi:hypothetical protein
MFVHVHSCWLILMFFDQCAQNKRICSVRLCILVRS